MNEKYTKNKPSPLKGAEKVVGVTELEPVRFCYKKAIFLEVTESINTKIDG